MSVNCVNIGSGNGHYLNQCWQFCAIPPESNFTASAEATILHNEFENDIFKFTVSFPRGKWVNMIPTCSTICRVLSLESTGTLTSAQKGRINVMTSSEHTRSPLQVE